MNLTTAQLYLMRSLEGKGWPADESIRREMMNRCSCSEEEWQALHEDDLIQKEDGRYKLSREGKRWLKKTLETRYI